MSASIPDCLMDYVRSTLRLTDDYTIFITDHEIQNPFDYLNNNDIQCNKGKVVRKDFYYVIPKCYSENVPLSGILVLGDMVISFGDVEKDKLGDTLVEFLKTIIAARSKTLYWIRVNTLFKKGYSYIILPKDLLEHANYALARVVRTGGYYLPASIIMFGSIVIIKLSDAPLPRWSLFNIKRRTIREDKVMTSYDIRAISKERAKQIVLSK